MAFGSCVIQALSQHLTCRIYHRQAVLGAEITISVKLHVCGLWNPCWWAPRAAFWSFSRGVSPQN